MQLDGPEPVLKALVGDVQELFGVPEGHGAGVSRDTISRTTDHLVEGQPGDFRRQVPERYVNDTEGIERQFLDAIDLPDLTPQVLLQQRILPDEDVSQPPIDEIDHDRATGCVGDALEAVVGPDRQPGRDRLHAGTGQSLPPYELMLDRLFNDFRFNRRDLH